jgi:hypothetical protein
LRARSATAGATGIEEIFTAFGWQPHTVNWPPPESLNGRKNEMVVRVVRMVIGFLPFTGKPMNVASAQSRWN